MKTNEQNESICCPQFDPSQWDEKTFQWRDKKFISDRVKTLFYIPLNFSQVMKRFDKTVREAGAAITDWLCLSEHTSKWNMNLHLAVDREIPGARNASLSGDYFCKVYEGPYKDAAKWKLDFERKFSLFFVFRQTASKTSGEKHVCQLPARQTSVHTC